MPSPLPQQDFSANGYARQGQHRKTSVEKIGTVHRTNSSTSLQRTPSNRSNGSTKGGKTHQHVVHANARPHRSASFGHRTPSFGKGLNKLTALTATKPQHASRDHTHSIHSTAQRPGGPEMQRSLSETGGNILAVINLTFFSLAKKPAFKLERQYNDFVIQATNGKNAVQCYEAC
jgi:hypothetical protein